MNSNSHPPFRILCFGDSNTWGYIPNTPGERYASETRWPGVLQQQLGNGFEVVEEALNGRTTVWDDPMKPDRNGSKQLPFILESHTPIDMVILALGVNDLKHHFQLTAIDVAMGIRTLADIVAQSPTGRINSLGHRVAPQLILISPALPVATPNPIGHKFDGATERGTGMAKAVEEMASELKCTWLDADQVVKIPDADGIHLDELGHQQLGQAVAELVRQQNDVASN